MTTPRIHYPSERTCPPALLAELRRVEPTAELLYVGEGRWVLGTVRPYWPNIQKAIGTLLKMERENASKLVAIAVDAEVNSDPARRREAARKSARNAAWLRVIIQGFRPIADYTITGEPDSRILLDFQRRDYLFRVQPDANDADNEAEALGDHAHARRVNALRDTLHTIGRKGWRQAIKGLTSIFTHGLRQRRLA